MKLVYLGFLVINLMIHLSNWDQSVGNYSNVAWLLITLWQPNGINVDNPFTWKHFQLKKKNGFLHETYFWIFISAQSHWCGKNTHTHGPDYLSSTICLLHLWWYCYTSGGIYEVCSWKHICSHIRFTFLAWKPRQTLQQAYWSHAQNLESRLT